MKRILLITALLCLVPLSAWGQGGAQIDADIAALKRGAFQVSDGQGVYIDEPDAQLASHYITNVKGVCASLTNSLPQSGDKANQCVYLNNRMVNGYTGVKIGLPDSCLILNVLCFQRDNCLEVPFDRSNCQSLGNHYFAAGQNAAFVDARGFKSIGDKFGDSACGYKGGPNASNSTITAGEFFQNYKRAAVFETQHMLLNCTVHVNKRGKIHADCMGLEISAPVSFIGGRIVVNWHQNNMDSEHKPAIAAVQLKRRNLWHGDKEGADRCRFDTTIDFKPGLTDERGFVVQEPIYGGSFQFFVTGCTDQGDLVLEIQSAAADMRGTIWEFAGAGMDKKQISKPANLDKSNTITVKDTATGKVDKVWP